MTYYKTEVKENPEIIRCRRINNLIIDKEYQRHKLAMEIKKLEQELYGK